MTRASRQLALLSLAELLGLSLWFSASAVLPALRREWGLADGGAAGLTIAVQAGFIVGTLLSALTNLPDVFSARAVMKVGIVLAAATNAALALWVSSLGPALALRFATGLFWPAPTPGDEDHGDVVSRRPGTGDRDPGRRPHRRLGGAAPRVGSDGAALARNLADRLGPCGRRCRGRPALGRRRSVPVSGGEVRHQDGRGRLRRPRAAAGVLRLPRPHVGALRDVGVDRRLPGGQSRGAGRRELRRTQPERRDLRRHRPGARSAAGSAVSHPTGGDGRRSRSSRWRCREPARRRSA